jgi:hypothetical protein
MYRYAPLSFIYLAMDDSNAVSSSAFWWGMWDVWSGRILATLVIWVGWEWFRRPAGAQPVEDPLPDKEEVQVPVHNNKKRSQLLDQFEARNREKHNEKSAEDSNPPLKLEKEESKDDIVPLEQSSKQSLKTTNDARSYTAPPASGTTLAATPATPLSMKATTNRHPGMQAFNYWYDVETSLFRIHTLGRTDNEPVFPPYTPHSHRGNVSIFLDVKNHTNLPIKVFWVNYQGKHIFKGDLKTNHVWTQSTYIDHPWVFEHAETQTPLLYYIPYRVIPTLPEAPTVSEEGIGRHQFVLRPPKSRESTWISIDDKILPFPAESHFFDPTPAIVWTLQHMSRMGVDILQVDTLLKYLTNIINDPSDLKYRQIRIRSARFAPIWMSPARGLLLAIGFVELGAYAELGCSQSLSRERVQDVALLTYLINQWKEKEESSSPETQPAGADGYGRAGFGRAGDIN